VEIAIVAGLFAKRDVEIKAGHGVSAVLAMNKGL
jgi:isopentenyl diphosphate isomerase/L-lactate dehydrogenase-like FMN-dependent dehydrogenase